jgi:hypothetical protein
MSTSPVEHPALVRDIHLLDRALAVPAGEPGWRHRICQRLEDLRGAFAEHTRVTEGPDGHYRVLLEHAPRLAHGIQVLIHEHAAIAATMSALHRRTEMPEVTADELRGGAGHLLRELSRHRQRGADLVYQAYQTDIGGET